MADKEKSDNKLKDKRILLVQQRGWGIRIGHFLAKKLQAEGCKLAAITLKRSTHKFIAGQPEVQYDFITNHDEVMNDPKKYLGENDYSLEEVCGDLEIDSIWPMVMSLRNHVKSYGQKYYYGFRQNVPDEEIVNYIKATYKQVIFVFNSFKPDLIISPNFVDLFHIMFNLYGRKKGIKMIAITASTIRGVRIFTDNYNEDSGQFYDRVDELNSGRAESFNREKARQYIKEFRQAYKQPESADNLFKKKSLLEKIRHALSPFYQTWLYFVKKSNNYIKSIGITVDYRPPRIIFRDHYCHDYYKKFMDKFDYYPFNKVNKYIYFPLQFQPEATIDVIAPYFSNQIETARQVAMSLPDDYTLAVKEHPAMVGLRPPSYIKKIALTPNVKFIDYRTSKKVIFKNTDLIISPSGTSLVEAAFYQKPAIQLGNLGTTLKLPNVFKHSNMTTLSAKIKEVLKADLNNQDYERRLENYVAAAYDTGLEFNYQGLWLEGKGDRDFFWEKYKQEIERILCNNS